MGLNSVGNLLGSVTGKTETGVSVKSNHAKCLGYMQCFNVS